MGLEMPHGVSPLKIPYSLLPGFAGAVAGDAQLSIY